MQGRRAAAPPPSTQGCRVAGLQPYLRQHRVEGTWPSEQAVVRRVEAHVALGTRAHLTRRVCSLWHVGLQPLAQGGSLFCTGLRWLSHAVAAHGVAASDAQGGGLSYPGLQPLAHGAVVSRRTDSSRWRHASAGLGKRPRTGAPRAAAPRRARAGKVARCDGGAASSSCTQSQSSATCASWPKRHLSSGRTRTASA